MQPSVDQLRAKRIGGAVVWIGNRKAICPIHLAGSVQNVGVRLPGLIWKGKNLGLGFLVVDESRAHNDATIPVRLRHCRIQYAFFVNMAQLSGAMRVLAACLGHLGQKVGSNVCSGQGSVTTRCWTLP